MRKLIILFLAAGVAFAAPARSKLDAGSRARLRASSSPIEIVKTGKGAARAAARTAANIEDAPLRAFVTVEPGTTAQVLEDAGATVRSLRGNIALAEFPREALPTIEALPEVTGISLERALEQKLDRARSVTGVDRIHNGEELPQAYTGQGVVAGIVDGGFDPNHINFVNDDGTSRIGCFTYFRPTQQGEYVEERHKRDYIPKIDTEDDDNYHGTHTLGIMAGSYKGDLVAGIRKSAFAGETATVPNPYYGAATGADLAIAAGALSDYYIALGVDAILDYAYYDCNRSPAVVNLSLGSNVGPHDGSSTICRFLDAMAVQDPVIFCLAAGNEGELPIAINKTFTEDDKMLKSCLYPAIDMPNYTNVRYGQTYIYSDTSEPFEVQALIINRNRGVEAARIPLPPTDGGSIYWVSSADYQSADTDVISPQFAKWFTGYLGVGAEYDAVTGRYYAVLDYMTWDNPTGNAQGNYIIGFQVTGKAGQRIDVFCDGVYNNLDDYGIKGYSKGSPDGSISDVACGHNYVVVGSYNTRDDWASLDGGIYAYPTSFDEGKITTFSSYGTLYDGRTLPTVCAPGVAIISSSNEYYLDKYNAGDGERQAALTLNGRRYSWHQSAGTSMATPLMSGSIALWLEADPSLRYDDVLDIIRTTAVQDEYTATSGTPVQWGAGKFDAYAGIKEVLRRKQSGVGSVSADNDKRLMLTAAGERQYKLCYGGAPTFTASIYTIAGTLAKKVSGNDGEAFVDASDLGAGVYILSVDGTSACTRLLIK